MWNDLNETKKVNVDLMSPMNNLIQIYNCYVNHVGTVVTRDNSYFWRKIDSEDRLDLGNFSVIGHYPHIFAIGYGEVNTNFGHCLEDLATPLLYFISYVPKELTKNAYFIYNGFPPVFDIILELFNIPQNRVIRFENKSFVSCDICSTITNPVPFINFFGIHGKRLHEYFLDKFELRKIKPKRYIFTNRPEDKPRCIHNLEEIMDLTKLMIPKIKWEYQEDIYNLAEASKVWASVKFWFCPVGSNVFKCYLMHPLTVIVVASCYCADAPTSAAIISGDIFCLMYNGIGGY
ncbi:hypothetical protein TVAG_138550 [Trichomonas vaginalis G3]|uniref:Glycosyltransferase 61 catalytic domain-containing protein n=1 Tax=Trichomonas vaginalis (strain ATCC PRA-98 / G3) TaxID=412133 RepID=A2ENK8_TRIV3|nr:glycosyltransferase family [Trichomonas vaginalis G3]EAY05786.1 hypothetical protein TVAG_138550 [Trichomonas vaginalis G3]KAI5511386.1 glycosyltransferase family [Trichomonas vaginalis G3]|eukprot:XP_001318009.1 hypothetical protein [Trichomonas vaginalis G3]